MDGLGSERAGSDENLSFFQFLRFSFSVEGSVFRTVLWGEENRPDGQKGH